jgi:molecular chaperone GrpE (heat shock protein)
MPDNNSNEINKAVAEAEKAVRDGAYVAVGFGVLAFQRAQVRRRELAKRLEQERANLTSQLNGTLTLEGLPFGEQLNELTSQLGGTGERLSDQWSEVGKSLAANVEATRAQLLDLVKTLDERVAPTRRQLDHQIEAFEERLPAGARNVVETFKAAAAVPEARLRSVVGLA